MPTVFEGEIFADYHQVYLADSVDPPQLPEEWSQDIVRQRLNMADRVLIVATARNMVVPFKVELHAKRPILDFAEVDHAVEGPLRVPSGELLIAGCTDAIETAARVAVPAGNLRALVLFRGLGTLSENGLNGDDSYTVHIWPETGSGVVVHQQWRGN
jgi:hypothetical protein